MGAETPDLRHAGQAPAGWTAPELTVIVPSYKERDNIAPLYHKLSAALAGVAWEMIVVDDNSPDGTADAARALSRQYANARVIQRIGRRGLSSAVIDADHQHDETILPQMLAQMADHEIAVGSRYVGSGSAGEGLSSTREKGSRFATQLSRLLTGVNLSDPMSGFFLMRREIFDEIAPSLSNEGFKILLDIIVTATRVRAARGEPFRIAEVPYTFRPRHAGESKMSSIIVVQFLGLLMSKLSRGILPSSFLLFSLVGASGVLVHIAVLWLTHEQMAFNFTNSQLTATVLTFAFEALNFNFANSQLAATLIAMTTNYILNNELTYADRRLRGISFWIGLISFYAVCSIGALANLSVASWIYQASPSLWLAGLTGAAMSVVFNYSVTRVFTWR
jgi:dolichol-phosphate mannosyltransferase